MLQLDLISRPKQCAFVLCCTKSSDGPFSSLVSTVVLKPECEVFYEHCEDPNRGEQGALDTHVWAKLSNPKWSRVPLLRRRIARVLTFVMDKGKKRNKEGGCVF